MIKEWFIIIDTNNIAINFSYCNIKYQIIDIFMLFLLLYNYAYPACAPFVNELNVTLIQSVITDKDNEKCIYF